MWLPTFERNRPSSPNPLTTPLKIANSIVSSYYVATTIPVNGVAAPTSKCASITLCLKSTGEPKPLITSSPFAAHVTEKYIDPIVKNQLRILLMPMESRVPGNWHARFGKQHRGNTGYAVRPYADFTQLPTVIVVPSHLSQMIDRIVHIVINSRRTPDFAQPPTFSAVFHELTV